MKTGIIFNIQHCSVHDGPGIRTVVFLKGCPLRCLWCANPESQKKAPQLAWTKQNCISCGGCLALLRDYKITLRDHDIHWDENALPDIRRVKRACPSTALHVIGEERTVDEVLKDVEKDGAFYTNSGGGLTLGGGEPLMQGEFAVSLLQEAKKRGMDTCIETSLCVPTETALAAAKYLDHLYTDVKCMAPEHHKKFTGVRNELILKNIRAVREAFPALPIRVRTPVIPGFNDTAEEIKNIRDFVQSLGENTEYELLKYHRLGQPKYESLHRDYPLGDVQLSEEIFSALKQTAKL